MASARAGAWTHPCRSNAQAAKLILRLSRSFTKIYNDWAEQGVALGGPACEQLGCHTRSLSKFPIGDNATEPLAEPLSAFERFVALT